MRKTLLLVMLCLLSMLLRAGNISGEQARQQALRFVAGQRATVSKSVRQADVRQSIPIGALNARGEAPLYAVNIGAADGFVIVIVSDLTETVLGYADSGTFDVRNMPDNLRAWLQGYADEIAWMEAHGAQTAPSAAPAKSAVKRSISPLLSCEWNQTEPYYNSTPLYGEQHCLTGCVATAMAQVMYFHKWPVDATAAIPAYTTNDALGTLPELSATTFIWNAMYDTYTADEDGPEVAKLMRYCGQSVEMNYGTGASGAVTKKVAFALKEYFGYDNSTVGIDRDSYTAAQWTDLIYGELQQSRPVVYGGQSSGGGHAFVIDGYGEDNYFHVNWGWGGSKNGYFLLSVLNPYSNSGSGASLSNDGYSYGQDAIVGIQPNKGTAVAERMTSSGLLATATSATRATASDNFTLSLNAQIYNLTGKEYTFDFGVGAFSEDDELLRVLCTYSSTLPYNSGYNGLGWNSVPFGAGLADGTYVLKNISRIQGTETWLKNVGADKTAVYVTISENTLTVTNATVDLTLSELTTTGTLKPNNIIQVQTDITNNGTFFNDYLYLFVDGKLAGGKIFEAKAGTTVAFSIEYTPTTEGTKTIKIATDEEGTNVLKTGSVDISATEWGAASISLGSATVNGTANKVYGNTIKVQFDVENTHATDTYRNGIVAELRRVVSRDEGSYSYYVDQTKTDATEIGVGETKSFSFEFSDLTYGQEYIVAYGYYDQDREAYLAQTSSYTIAHGFTTIDAQGNVTATEPTDNVTVPAGAVVADLRGQTTVTSVTPNDNANCLYLLDADATVPEGLSGANVVKGGVADRIVLVDNDYGFQTPVSFTANAISYTRTPEAYYSTEGGVGKGWMTLTLPFEADRCTTDDGATPLGWFTSAADTGKDFWIYQFGREEGSNVVFTHAPAKLEANTPYIVALPGAQFGSHSLADKSVTFSSSTPVSVEAGAKAVLTGVNYKFVGTQTPTGTLTGIYALNPEGSTFKQGNATVVPFRAYFAPVATATAASALNIVIGGSTTGISLLEPAPAADAPLYDLSGRRVGSKPARGLYIVNGKKVIIR